jgi:hypothetical protein
MMGLELGEATKIKVKGEGGKIGRTMTLFPLWSLDHHFFGYPYTSSKNT